MYECTKEYINGRIDQIRAARMRAEYKEKKIEEIKNALFAYFRGLITEDELLYICA